MAVQQESLQEIEFDIKEVREILKKSEFMKIEFTESNPHSKESKAWQLFEKIKGSKIVKEAKEKGASLWDLGEYVKKGNLRIEGIENPMKKKDKKEKDKSKNLDKENSDKDKEIFKQDNQDEEMNSLESNPKKRIQFDGINFEDRIQARKD